jgi:hypothetical protein
MQDFLTPFQDSITHAATSANVAWRSLPVAVKDFSPHDIQFSHLARNIDTRITPDFAELFHSDSEDEDFDGFTDDH